MPTTVIRRATPADAQAIAQIHVSAWRAAYNDLIPDEVLGSLSVERREELWRKDLEAGIAAIWVAESGEAIVGWISVGRSRDPDASAGTGELWAMYIDPAHWRVGIGRALWSAARAHLRGAGLDDVTLWVLKENARGLAFYAAIGFTIDVGRVKTIELGGATLEELRLRCRIAA